MKADCLSLMFAVLLSSVAALSAAPPEQFRVWGTAGPDLPPAPKGWTELPPTPTGPTSLAPTADEQRRGYILFARDPFVPVSPDSPPFPSERTDELKASAARGEYEPLTFGIHALEALDAVSVQVSDLRGAKDDLIPADHVDARLVRCLRVPVDARAKTCRLEPFLIEKRPAFSVARARTAQVWLTLKVPETAQGGSYSGTVSVKAAGREATQLKLSVQVFPFALPPAPIEMAMYYGHPPASDEILLKELTDIREHGLNSFESAVGVQIKSRDQAFGDDDVAATRAHCRRIMDATKQVFGGWRFPTTFEVGFQIAYYWDKDKNWFVHWPHSQKIDGDFYKAIDVVRDLAKSEGWPPLRAYAMDEAGAHNLLDEAVYYYGLIKKRYPDLVTWTDIGGGIAMGHDEIGQLSGVIDVFSTNRFTPEIAAALLARKKPYGVYNGAGHTLAGPRYFFGFYGFKTGAEQIAQWVYHFGDGGLKGLRQDDEGYVYPGPDGPLPSLYWESVREGVDDYRYVHLLRQLCSLARESSETTTNQTLKGAEQALAATLGQINWRFQALASSERTPPPHPSTLRKWRRRLAAHIAALLPLLRSELRPPVPPVSPVDFPWAAPGEDELKHGPELLPPSGFEAGLKPWQVQPWNGKGKGELDPAEHHGGKQSVRLDVPADSGSQAVTVLVWPSWSGGGLDLTLARDRTYELSAWVKWQGRNVPPSPRISVPSGADRSTREGKDKPAAAEAAEAHLRPQMGKRPARTTSSDAGGSPAPDGWTRIWTRVEMAFPTVPKYLAIWVQGPGTVWVDDLSLREVIPPPLAVSLDQEEYDGHDRVGVASVSVSKLATPAQVRFAILAKDGTTAADATAPFETRAALGQQGKGGVMVLAPASLREAQFVFDPSKLALGSYEARVELLDGQGKPFASQSVRLERVAD